MADAPASKKNPGLLPALEELLRDATAGDPISGLKWTHKSTRKLSRALRRLGYAIGPDTVARLLREHDFSLRTNRKWLARTRDPDRDRQFQNIEQWIAIFEGLGQPVVSVDAKKKELIGNFKNPGAVWCLEPEEACP